MWSWQAAAISGDGNKLIVGEGGSFTGYLYTSEDGGATWTQCSSPQYWRSSASSADGTRLLAAASKANSNGCVFQSFDRGSTWTQRASALQWSAVACSADGTRLVAVVNGGDIYTSSGPVP